MTGAAANYGAFLGPIIHVDDACLQVQTYPETDNLTIVVTLEFGAFRARASIAIMIICCASLWTPAMSEASLIFADWAPLYRNQGFWPRPILPNTKARHARDWQKPEAEIPIEVRERWLRAEGHYGVPLLQEVMRHPADDPPRNRAAVRMDRSGAARGGLQRTADRGDGRCLTNPWRLRSN
jgi:hypothetical protein